MPWNACRKECPRVIKKSRTAIQVLFMDDGGRDAQASQDLGLGRPHAPPILCRGVVVSEQVQDTMHHQELNFLFEGMPARPGLGFGAWQRDDNIAQVATAGLWVRFRGREGQYVRRRILVQVIPVKSSQAVVTCQDQGQVRLWSRLLTQGL